MVVSWVYLWAEWRVVLTADETDDVLAWPKVVWKDFSAVVS